MVPAFLTRVFQRLGRLPGLGTRSARRIVLHLLRNKNTLRALIDDLSRLDHLIRPCSRCGLWDEDTLCTICKNPSRQDGTLCVIMDVAEAWAFERAGCFKGQYHLLHSLSPGDIQSTQAVDMLLSRCQEQQVKEVILTFHTTFEGQASVYYIHQRLTILNPAPQITLLGRGIPWGGEIDYLDEGTLTAAFAGRRTLNAPV